MFNPLLAGDGFTVAAGAVTVCTGESPPYLVTAFSLGAAALGAGLKIAGKCHKRKVLQVLDKGVKAR